MTHDPRDDPPQSTDETTLSPETLEELANGLQPLAPPPARAATARTMNRAGSPGRANAKGPRLRVVAPGQGVIGGWKTATVARTPRARAIDQASDLFLSTWRPR